MSHHDSLSCFRAAEHVRRGGLLIHPAEGVYGIGCHPLRPASVQRLQGLKQRASDRGFVVLVDSVDAAIRWSGCLSQDEQQLLRDSWPGRVTWVMKTQRSLRWLDGGQQTVALRVTTHPKLSALLRDVGSMVTTSLNQRGQPPAVAEDQICDAKRALDPNNAHDIRVMSGEPMDRFGPTEIRNLHSGAVLRTVRKTA